MQKIREIIRLKESTNLSERAISRALSISRPVVKQYIQDIHAAGLDYAAIKAMNDDTLIDVLTAAGKSRSAQYQVLHDQFGYFAKELKRTGVTLQRLWQEYRDIHPHGYSYSRFCYHFQVWRSSSELTMHMTHKAGDKMFVDFTGKKLEIVDRRNGKAQAFEVFTAVLGASQLTYVEAVVSQKKQDWIKANQNALHYFGGVPQAIVPDCLKSAVTVADKYEPDIHPEYFDFARHYQTTILPARPHHPKDKALVEGTVKIVYAWIFAALRNRTFHSLDDLNSAIYQELEAYNTKPMQKLKLSRRELFEQTEKAFLQPLPAEKYTQPQFKRLKAQFNYHIYLSEDKHYYSLPYRYRGQKILVIYTDSVVELFCKNQRIAFHKRDRTPMGYTTVKDHMPSHHRFVSEWNPQRLTQWARKIGPHVQRVVEHILARASHPEQGYKTCLGIIHLAKVFDPQRLDKACQRAIEFEHYAYKGIKNILENRMENQQLDCFEDTAPEHRNIRGRHYYQ